MEELDEILQQNKEWAGSMRHTDPQFFERLKNQQSPELLWIGCSDSRVPANQIAGQLPGSIFVQRNVANVVNLADKNCMAVVQFGVDVLQVKHIIVVGHYGCGGVRAVLQRQSLGLVSEWLRPIEPVRDRFWTELQAMPENEQWNTLCELNVIAQAQSAARIPSVQEAWARNQELWIHGWIYGVHDGVLRDLRVTLGKTSDSEAVVERCFRSVLERHSPAAEQPKAKAFHA